jgi:hypothetical protein
MLDTIPAIQSGKDGQARPLLRSAGDFLAYLEQHHPEEVVRVAEPINPAYCEHAALEEYLAQRNRYP